MNTWKRRGTRPWLLGLGLRLVLALGITSPSIKQRGLPQDSVARLFSQMVSAATTETRSVVDPSPLFRIDRDSAAVLGCCFAIRFFKSFF